MPNATAVDNSLLSLIAKAKAINCASISIEMAYQRNSLLFALAESVYLLLADTALKKVRV